MQNCNTVKYFISAIKFGTIVDIIQLYCSHSSQLNSDQQTAWRRSRKLFQLSRLVGSVAMQLTYQNVLEMLKENFVAVAAFVGPGALICFSHVQFEPWSAVYSSRAIYRAGRLMPKRCSRFIHHVAAQTT